ncbi:MAG: hypothetical protein AAF903_10665 [Pseudomonadota bacterium]
MNAAAELIETTAGDRELSIDGWMALVALNLDQPALPRQPENMDRQEAILRLALIREIVGPNAAQRRFRKLVAKGKGRAELDALWDAWLEYRSSFDAPRPDGR